MGNRRAGSEAYLHPVGDELRGCLGGDLLLGVEVWPVHRGDTSRRIVEMATKTDQRTDIDELCINTIRTLSMDAIQKANSGHPGTPMALAPLAYTLWQRYLRFDPADPIWPGRDRFVLSAGHASMLLYSLLYLARVKAVDPDYEIVGQQAVTLDDIKNFRQLDSKCPGHPEYRI